MATVFVTPVNSCHGTTSEQCHAAAAYQQYYAPPPPINNAMPLPPIHNAMRAAATYQQYHATPPLPTGLASTSSTAPTGPPQNENEYPRNEG